MWDEEEKNASLSDKWRECGFTSVTEAENQKDRMEETAIEGYMHVENLGNI